MSTKTRERLYRMKLPKFDRYLADKRKELRTCYKEVREVQEALKGNFQRELEAWQERFTFCYPQVSAQRTEMPAAFARIIERTIEEERERFRQEMADLDEENQQGRAKMDELQAKAQERTKMLKAANPGLNDREEHLKELMVNYQDEYADAYEQLEVLDTSALSWFKNAGKIRRLKRTQKLAKKHQDEALQQLRQVRQEWLAQVEEAGDTQAELRSDWQEMGVKVAEAEGRLEYVKKNSEALAVDAGIQRVLEELDKPPQVSGELGEALDDLVQRNHVRWDYEKGLVAAGEALGITKSIGEGMKRFHQSVSEVVREQRRHNLKQVYVVLPHSVAILNETWKELSTKARDAEALGKNPIAFDHIVDTYIRERLTDESIQRLFEIMGQSLGKATDAWN